MADHPDPPSRQDSDPSDSASSIPDAASRSLEERVARLERLVAAFLAPEDGAEGLLSASAAEAPATGPSVAEPAAEPAGTAAGGPVETPEPPSSPEEVPAGPAVYGAGVGVPVSDASGPAAVRRSSGSASSWTLADWSRLGDVWLGRVGIGLLLLGLVFLFRYVVEQGWVTPWVRVALGLQVGGLLLVVGLWLSERRPLYSQLLLGGALGTFYIVGWAATLLYELVPYGLGLSYMATVTVLGLALAERKGHETLALIGAGGGLASPFLLGGTGSAAWLVGYGALVLGGAAVLQARHAWRYLLAVMVVGGLGTMAFAASRAPDGHLLIARLGVAYTALLPLLLGERQDDEELTAVAVALGLLAVAGIERTGSVAWLVGGGTLVLAVGGWIQARRGWRNLLAVITVGGLATMALATAVAGEGERLLAQGGLAVAWLAAVALPYGRRRMRLRNPEAWPEPEAGQFLGSLAELHPGPHVSGEGEEASEDRLARGFRVYLLAAGLGGSAVVAGLTISLWSMGSVGTGLVFQSLAVLMAGVAWLGWERRVDLATPAAISAAALLAFGTSQLFEPEWIFLPLALEGALFVLVAREWKLGGFRQLGVAVFALLAVVWVMQLQALPTWDQPPFSLPALGVLGAIGVAAGCSLLVPSGNEARAYLLGAHGGLLLWLGRELTPLPRGIELVSVVWGLYGVLIVAMGIRDRNVVMKVLGFATLAVVVLKLLIVDLLLVDPVWRIVMLLAFGGVFLVLSYFARQGEEVAPPGMAGVAAPAE